MKTDRIVMWLVNLLLAAAFAFSILVLMEQFPAVGWEWYSRCFLGAPVLICFVAGLCARNIKPLRYALLPISAVGAAAIVWVLFPSHGRVDILFIVLCAFLGTGLFFLGLRGDQPFPSQVALATIIIFIFDCAYFYLNTGVVKEIMPLTYCALGAFLLSLYSFNTNSLHNGLHNVKGGGVMAVPAGLRSRNIIMLTVFLLIAVPLASLGFVHNGLSAVFGFLLRCIWSVMKAITSTDDSSAPAPTPEVDDEPQSMAPALGGEEGGGLISLIVPIFIGIMLILFVVGMILVFVPKGEGRGGRMSDWLKRLFKVKEVEAYEDSIERLLDLKGILKKGRDSVKGFFDKLTATPQKLEDMPNGPMKIRFAYKFLLNSSRVNQRAVYFTPTELSKELGLDEVEKLAEAYNAVRYKENGPADPSYEATAKSAISAIRSKRR